jgi:large subunit ribosomal protein L15
MKLHDLQPAKGAHTPRTRVGRGIAAGKGKTAGRGTKGQKARAGGTIPPWFEGGQTPIHIRIPKLRGFRNRGRIEYEVVNLGRISQLVELGVLESGELPGAKAPKSGKAAPITVNQEILRAAGLVSTLNKPLKVLGHGEVSTPLFVVADAFSKSAVSKIEAAGGSVQVIEVPATPLAALVGEPAAASDAAAPTRATAKAEAIRTADAAPAAATDAAPGDVTSEAPEARVDESSPVNADAAAEAPADAPSESADAAPKRSRRKASDDEAGGAA